MLWSLKTLMNRHLDTLQAGPPPSLCFWLPCCSANTASMPPKHLCLLCSRTVLFSQLIVGNTPRGCHPCGYQHKCISHGPTLVYNMKGVPRTFDGTASLCKDLHKCHLFKDTILFTIIWKSLPWLFLPCSTVLFLIAFSAIWQYILYMFI